MPFSDFFACFLGFLIPVRRKREDRGGSARETLDFDPRGGKKKP
jgi:hypothetical protein